MAIRMCIARVLNELVWFQLPYGYVFSVEKDELGRMTWAIHHPDLTGLQTMEIIADGYDHVLWDDVQRLCEDDDLYDLFCYAYIGVEKAIEHRENATNPPCVVPDMSWQDVPF